MTVPIPYLPLLAQGGDDEGIPWGLVFWVVVVFVLPTAAKGLAWIARKLGLGGDEPEEAPDERRARRIESREALQELEERGIERWRGLREAEAEDLEPPPLPRPTPAPAPAPAAPASVLEEVELPSTVGDGLARLEPTLGPAAAPLADIGGTLDRTETLSTFAEGRPGAGRSRPGPRRRVARLGPADTSEPVGRGVDWRRAVVLSEILGGPVALRDPREPGGPAGLR